MIRRLVVAIFVSGLYLAAGAPVSAAVHEDPDSAVEIFSGLELLAYYAGSLELVPQEPDTARRRLADLAFAYVPEPIEDTVADFTVAGGDLVGRLTRWAGDIALLRQYAARSRLAEAAALRARLAADIERARAELDRLESAVTAAGREFAVMAAPPGSDLRQAYDDALTEIDRLRRLLDTHEKLSLDSLPPASPALRSTAISLEVTPAAAFVGDAVGISGRLTAGPEPLAGRRVELLVDGVPCLDLITDADGIYRGTFTVPYRYVAALHLQALYYPGAADAGGYLAALSSGFMLDVLFYRTRLEITPAVEGYPGRTTAVGGRLSYEGSPAPRRPLEIYLDDSYIATWPAGGAFTGELKLAAGTATGSHVLTVSAAGYGRYGPAVTSVVLRVSRALPVLAVKTPRTLFSPPGAVINGEVSSVFGQVANAVIAVEQAGRRKEITTSAGGAFSARLGGGWGWSLLGWEDIRLTVTPVEPWLAPLTITRRLFTVNVINCGGTLLLVVVLGIYLPAKLGLRSRARTGLPRRSPVPPPLPAGPCATVPADANRSEAAPGKEGTVETLLAVYRGVLRWLLRTTHSAFQPHQTLRELARQQGGRLGVPLARYLMELTTIVERLLYSRAAPTETELETGRRLAGSITGGPPDEDG